MYLHSVSRLSDCSLTTGKHSRSFLLSARAVWLCALFPYGHFYAAINYKLEWKKKKMWKKGSNPWKANYKLSLVSNYRQNRMKSSPKIPTGYLFWYSVISAEVLKQHIISVTCPYTTARCSVLNGANLHWLQAHQSVCWEWENDKIQPLQPWARAFSAGNPWLQGGPSPAMCCNKGQL